jgi:autotransporter passenger strand-loop-strand repeat protein
VISAGGEQDVHSNGITVETTVLGHGVENLFGGGPGQWHCRAGLRLPLRLVRQHRLRHARFRRRHVRSVGRYSE